MKGFRILLIGLQMKDASIFLCMLFLHIVDDFKMQGILASFKQKSWWVSNSPEELYKYDWIISLVMHCLSWSFCIMFPIMVWYRFAIPLWFLFVFVINVVIHCIIDHLKANSQKINLVADQLCHIIQIIFTFTVFLLLR